VLRDPEDMKIRAEDEDHEAAGSDWENFARA